jgi:hypothetical protein
MQFEKVIFKNAVKRWQNRSLAFKILLIQKSISLLAT